MLKKLVCDTSTFYMPGELIGSVEILKEKYKIKEMKIGPGINAIDDKLYSTLAGFVAITKPDIFWIISDQKFYFPKLNDYVVGKIIKVASERYKVELADEIVAFLPTLAFTNATKQVKPQLNVGDLVYAKISSDDSNIDLELTCTEPSVKSSQLGPLTAFGSYVQQISLPLARRLLVANSRILKILKSKLPDNVNLIVGMNGFIYVSSQDDLTTLKIVEIIKKLEHFD